MLEYDQIEIPYKPPIIKFIDIPWSPFVDEKTGKFCCDILIDQWSPVLFFRTALLSLSSLLSETKMPKREVGLNIEAAA
jgi:ubiquitin-protein ligase